MKILLLIATGLITASLLSCRADEVFLPVTPTEVPAVTRTDQQPESFFRRDSTEAAGNRGGTKDQLPPRKDLSQWGRR